MPSTRCSPYWLPASPAGVVQWDAPPGGHCGANCRRKGRGPTNQQWGCRADPTSCAAAPDPSHSASRGGEGPGNASPLAHLRSTPGPDCHEAGVPQGPGPVGQTKVGRDRLALDPAPTQAYDSRSARGCGRLGCGMARIGLCFALPIFCIGGFWSEPYPYLYPIPTPLMPTLDGSGPSLTAGVVLHPTAPYPKDREARQRAYYSRSMTSVATGDGITHPPPPL